MENFIGKLEISLDHSDPRLFETSQWSWHPLVYVVYRIIWAVYFIIILILSWLAMKDYGDDVDRIKWIIYVSNWSLLLLTFTLILEAIVAIMALRKRGIFNSYDDGNVRTMTWYLKMEWVLYNITTCSALLVSLAFWTLIFKHDEAEMSLTEVNFNTHAMNSIYVLIDLCITAIPIRLLHVLHTVVLALVYIIFNVIYSVTGGTNTEGKQYIYQMLYWNQDPTISIIYTTAICLLLLPLLWLFAFGIFKLRILVYKSFESKDLLVHDEESQLDERGNNYGTISQLDERGNSYDTMSQLGERK